MKTKLIKKMVCGLTIGCLVLSLGGLALAHDGSDNDIRPNHPPQEGMPNPGDMEHHINKSLEKLVNEGTITQNQSDKIMHFFKEKDSQRKIEMEKTSFQQKSKKHPDMIAELKDIADLSDEQSKIVADALRPPHGPNPNGPCPMTPRP